MRNYFFKFTSAAGEDCNEGGGSRGINADTCFVWTRDYRERENTCLYSYESQEFHVLTL